MLISFIRDHLDVEEHYPLKFLRHSFLSIIAVVVFCIFLLAATLQQIQSLISEHYLQSHTRMGQSLAQQIDKELQKDNDLSFLQTDMFSSSVSFAIFRKDGSLVTKSPGLKLEGKDIGFKPAQLSKSTDGWLVSFHPLIATDNVLGVYQSDSSLQTLHAWVRYLFLTGVLLVGGLISFVITFNTRDIKKDIRRYIRETRYEAIHDRLTGLINRDILMDRVEHSLYQAKRNDTEVALVYLDIDNLNQINEQSGHAYGDQVLKAMANRLKSVNRESDSLARVDGGTFGVLMENIQREEEVSPIIERLISECEKPFKIGSHTTRITISMGVSFAQESQQAENLMHNAFAAMVQAKQEQGVSCRYYNEEMTAPIDSELQIESELYQALENEEFQLFYQPKVDSVSGSIKGMEALIRWQHPKRGLVPPIDFIPVLEQTGLIVPVGEWVLREACRANRHWQEQGLPEIKVSVNVATPQFKQKNFIGMVNGILEETGLSPKYLEIELTESSLMDDDSSNIETLNQLKALGISISVDDFGTGYSSLSYLKRFPIDTLKIDRSFITNVNDRASNDNAAIVTAIMALSHSLRLDVVAEGVETAQELAYLHALGCRTIQGFLFSKPLSHKEFTSLLEDSVSLRDTLEAVRTALQ